MARRPLQKHVGGLHPRKYLGEARLRRVIAYVHARAEHAKPSTRRAFVNRMIIETLLLTGVRAAELLSLKLYDLPKCLGEDIVYVQRGKGGVSRSIDVPKILTQRLDEFIRTCRKGARGGSPLFVNEKGKPMSYPSLLSRMRVIGRRAGVGRLTPHMMRHTFGTRLYNVKQDLLYVKRQMGHANITTTEIYAQTATDAGKQQTKALADAVLSP